jgi:ribonuclease R
MFILTQSIKEKILKYFELFQNYDQNLISIIDNQFIINKKYKIGLITVHNRKFYLSCQTEAKEFLIEKDSLQGADEGDFVLTKVIFNPRGKLKVKIARIIEKNNEATLIIFKDGHFSSFKNGNNLHMLNNISAKEDDIFLHQDEKFVFFGNINDPLVDEKISLFLHGEDFRLNRYSLENPDKTISLKNRLNLTHLDFCTIDPVGAKDHDDAIYFDHQKHILYVAIADVSHYVKEGTSLDNEAKKRSFSVYFPKKVLPMLPFELSSDLCSLKPNELRYAFVCKIELNSETFSVKKSEFIEAVIESKNNFSYEMIDEMIQHNILKDDLKALINITQTLREKRLKNGYNFRNEEFKLILNEEEKLFDVKSEHSTISHQLVEECMLLANQESAKKIGNIGIFRVHEEPDMKKIDKLIDDLLGIGLHVKKKKDIHSTILGIQKEASRFYLEKEVDKLIIKAQQQAKYSNQKGNHFGLGFSNYSHFTSPIRRYPDLILHRILKTKEIPQDIDELCEKINNQEREIARMVWDLEGRKYARWAKENLNQNFEAVIVEIGDKIQCELLKPLCGLSFQLQNYKGEKLYSKITVSLVSADLVSKNIEGRRV